MTNQAPYSRGYNQKGIGAVKMIQRLAGLLIIIGFFVGLVLFVGEMTGIAEALIILAKSIGITAVVVLGVFLLCR